MRWKRVIYCSRSTVSMDNPLNLAEILGASARNNRRDEITGALAYSEGIFIQAIEGSPHAVDALMGRLRSDTRHTDLQILGQDWAEKRAFSVWIMETPRMRPERSRLLERLVEGCEGAYGSALWMMLEFAAEEADHRRAT